MRNALLAIWTLTGLCPVSAVHAGLPRSSPESQGVASAAVLDFINAADEQLDSLHSVMIVRHGQVIAEGWWTPYRAEANHALYSLSKSFTSTAVGLAVAEGRLSLDDKVLNAFPADAPEMPDAQLRNMRLRDLLRMSTGQQTEPPRPPQESWRKAFLAHPVPFKPGTHFLYNTSATYMAAAMVEHATGEKLLDYLRPRLFDPLGIDHPTWEISPDGVATGGYGLSVRTEDIASFGLLYLQRGRWGNQQLLPADWVDAATARQTSNGSNPDSDWDQGYGYQFWRCRHGAYRGDGAFGQFCLVLPEQDAVIAITSGLKNMQAVLDLVWSRLLPAFESQSLPENATASAALQARLAALTLKTVAGEAAPAAVLRRTYSFAENDRQLQSLRVDPGPDDDTAAVLTLRLGDDTLTIPLGRNRWHDGTAAWGTLTKQPAAACGAWTTPQSLTARLCFYETPFVVSLRMEFAGDEVTVHAESNVGFGATKSIPITGRADAAVQ